MTYGDLNYSTEQINNILQKADTLDTSNFATTDQLNSKLDTTVASQTYQPKGNYITEIPSEYVTESELTWSNITNTPSTLEGYEITDAVTSNTEQTITEVKKFNKGIDLVTSRKIFYSDSYWYIPFAIYDENGIIKLWIKYNDSSGFNICIPKNQVSQLAPSVDYTNDYGLNISNNGLYRLDDKSFHTILDTGNYPSILDKRYVTTTQLGDINTILDNINGEVI